MDEVVDVMEVVEALAKTYGITEKEMKRNKRKKNNERGSFEKRLWLEYVEEL